MADTDRRSEGNRTARLESRSNIYEDGRCSFAPHMTVKSIAREPTELRPHEYTYRNPAFRPYTSLRSPECQQHGCIVDAATCFEAKDSRETFGWWQRLRQSFDLFLSF